jgi:hypothetical protein
VLWCTSCIPDLQSNLCSGCQQQRCPFCMKVDLCVQCAY